MVRVELTTDDEHESDTVSVTYPRTASGSRPKKVRFNKEMKAALKLSETESSTSTSASKPEAAVETTRKTSDKPKDR